MAVTNGDDEIDYGPIVYYHEDGEEQTCDMGTCRRLTTRMAKFEGRDEDLVSVCEDGGHTDDKVRKELTYFIETYR